MLFRLLGLAAAMAALASLASPAHACSVRGDYVRPSNFELVQLADAIVIATAGDASGQDRLTFAVVERVKGTAPPRLLLRRATLRAAAPSDLDTLHLSHREGHAGPCNCMSFSKGRRYLLFLGRSVAGEWLQLQYPFSRINEDYAGEETAWMRTVRRYVRLQRQLKPMEQLAALERMVASGRDDAGVALRAAELQDIRDHLSSPSPYKPTAFLLKAHADAVAGRQPAHGLRPRSADAEQSQAAWATGALAGEQDARPVRAEQAEGRTLAALAEGDHPEARPLFERLLRERSDDPVVVAAALHFEAKHGRYARAFRWIEEHLMSLLPRLGDVEARWLIGRVAVLQRGEDRTEGHERWRDDARATSAWPELALSLHQYQLRRFGLARSFGFEDAIRTLRPADPRARPQVALALAADAFDPLHDWAAEQLRDERARAAWERQPQRVRDRREDPALLPLRIILSANYLINDGTLPTVFCQSAPRRRLLIRTLGEDIDPQHYRLLGRIAASSGLDAEDRTLLARSMARVATRSNSDFPSGGEERPIVCRR